MTGIDNGIDIRLRPWRNNLLEIPGKSRVQNDKLTSTDRVTRAITITIIRLVQNSIYPQSVQ